MNRLHLALLLLAAGCQSDPDAAPPEKPSGGKGDDPARICVALGEPATCDVCDVAGWYGDGECDRFCENPDSDCPAQPINPTDFLAQTNVPAKKITRNGFAGSVVTTVVATELSEADVEGWLNAGAPMIGNGYALHMRFKHRPHWTTSDSNVQTIAITDHTDSGQCMDDPLDTEVWNSEMQFGVYAWGGTQSTLVACPVGGSIKVTPHEDGNEGAVKISFNLLWSDGTTWSNRTITASEPTP